MTLLRVENLSVALPKGADRPFAAEDVGFDLAPGEILCIVGESAHWSCCAKSGCPIPSRPAAPIRSSSPAASASG